MKIQGIFLGMVVSLAFWHFSQTRASMKRIDAQLVQDRAALQERKAQVEEMRAQPVEPPDMEQMRQLEEERRGLMKLRGEYTRYSSTQPMSTEGLEQEITTIKARTEAILAESDFKAQRRQD